MLQLIETICYQNGTFQRVPLHEERMNRSRRHLFQEMEPLSLAQLLKIPESLKFRTVRCRVTYAREIENIEYELYNTRLISSLKLVYDDAIDYSHKYRNRDSLNSLLNRRGDADEILVVKHGLITDTSFTNVVFLKEGIWYTPATPLLPGTRREYYLQLHRLLPLDIRPEELYMYKEARLINAMISIDDSVSIPTTNIFH